MIKPNRNGYVQVGPAEFHKKYLKDDRRKHPPIASLADYRAVLNFLFTRVWFYLFKDKWIFKMPCGLGYLYIAESVNSNGQFIDWVLSKEKGKKVNNYNFHSNGRKFFVKWDRTACMVRHLKVYNFKPHRGSKEEMIGSRGLAQYIKQCAEDPHTPDFRGHII